MNECGSVTIEIEDGITLDLAKKITECVAKEVLCHVLPALSKCPHITALWHPDRETSVDLIG